MTTATDITRLIGRTLVVVNVDDDFLNLRDGRTGEQFWLQSDSKITAYQDECEAGGGAR